MHWLRVGAQPSDQVRNLMVKVGIWDRFVAERPSAAGQVRVREAKPDEPKLSKKASAKAETAAAEAEVAAPVDDASAELGGSDPETSSEPETSAEPETPATTEE